MVDGSAVPAITAIPLSSTLTTSNGENANIQLKKIEEWLLTENPLPRDVNWSFAGEANDQAESQAFLTIAFSGALGLMFVILLAIISFGLCDSRPMWTMCERPQFRYQTPRLNTMMR